MIVLYIRHLIEFAQLSRVEIIPNLPISWTGTLRLREVRFALQVHKLGNDGRDLKSGLCVSEASTLTILTVANMTSCMQTNSTKKYPARPMEEVMNPKTEIATPATQKQNV